MKKRLFIRYLAALLVLAISVFIFNMSAQTAQVSSDTSGSVITFFANFLIKGFKEMDIAQQEIIISAFQNIVRKAAHFSVYFLLGVCTSAFIATFNNLKQKSVVLIPLLYCLLYAVADEFHQTFVSGRSGQFSDVLLDGFGALCGIVVVFLVFLKIKKSKKTNGGE